MGKQDDSRRKSPLPAAARQAPRPPAAPPVYRPQPTPKVLQRKAPPGRSPQPSAPASRPTPAAPPVYRPQPAPKVLQRKTPPAAPRPVPTPDRGTAARVIAVPAARSAPDNRPPARTPAATVQRSAAKTVAPRPVAPPPPAVRAHPRHAPPVIQRKTLNQLLDSDLGAFRARVTRMARVGALLQNDLPYHQMPAAAVEEKKEVKIVAAAAAAPPPAAAAAAAGGAAPPGPPPPAKEKYAALFKNVLFIEMYELTVPQAAPFPSRSAAVLEASAAVAGFGTALTAVQGARGIAYLKEKTHKAQQEARLDAEWERQHAPSAAAGAAAGRFRADPDSIIPDVTGAPFNQQLMPFVLRVSVNYLPGGEVNVRTLKLDFQFAGAYTGYVTHVQEEMQGKIETSGSMYIPKGEDFRKLQDDRRDEVLGPLAAKMGKGCGFYANVHEKTEGTSISGIVDGPAANAKGQMRQWDAVTKLVAESSRWLCVRDAAARGLLSDDLVFYTAHGAGYVGMKFSDLWLNWRDFGNGYNIPNAKVIEILKAWAGGARCAGTLIRSDARPPGGYEVI